MKRLEGSLAAAALLGLAVVAHAATIKAIRVDEFGHDKVNRIGAPIFVTTGVAPLRIGAITSAYDRKAKVVRGYGNMFTKGPTYDLDGGVDLGALFAQSLRDEARAMGFAEAREGEKAWEISGTLKNMYTESQQITGYGAVLSYGFSDLDLVLRSPGGDTQNRAWRAHTFFGKVNMGFGRKDEAEAGLAHLLVEGAQDILARFNRELVKARPAPGVEEKLRVLTGSGVADHQAELHLVGLSGLPAAVAPLLRLLEKEPNEDNRSALINALARLGSPEAIATLASRYDKEDEDCRWYTLKALDYIGDDKALAVLKEKGAKDQDEANKRLFKKLGL